MAIRSGQILSFGNGFLIDRIQTGGVSNVNIPTETIKEDGNFKNVGVVRDIPDLSWEMQSVDVSTDAEALLLGLDPSAVSTGDSLDFGLSVPLDVVSPFKSAHAVFTAVNGVIVPFLALENVTYRYGVRANAEQTFTLRSDAVYYTPGTPYLDTHAGGSTTYAFGEAPAIVYHERGAAIYALGVQWHDLTTGLFKRLIHGQDYTDTATGITLTAGVTIPATATVQIVYASLTATGGSATFPQSIHTSASVKPAAVRAKDIDIYIGAVGAGTLSRLTGTQTFELTRRVNLDRDEEFGSVHFISQDYDTADVTGTVTVRAYNPGDFVAKMAALLGTTSGEVVGANGNVPMQMEARIYHPDTGAILKTIYVPDAVFQVAPTSVRAAQKLDSAVKYTSDTGSVQVFKGARP